MEKIGRYEIRKEIGQGGMGKVYLAFDPVCQRQIALKMIKEEFGNKPAVQNRFLKEVHITSFLTHTSIIPVYTIHKDKDTIFYTMPYIEGSTLQRILFNSYKEQEQGKIENPIGRSIPTLVRLFLTLCETIDYTTSKGVLHRDIKPENIMIGQYGELFILDWGIAEKIDEQKPSPKEPPEKVTGTISFMAPERAMGKNANVKTEIYALGVILYRMLTLKLPFRRKDIKHYRKIMPSERLIDPIEAAPYREIPKQLCEIVKKCLADEDQRYSSIAELIEEVNNYIEGKPNWIALRSLDIKEKKDWLFQENMLLAKHIAITKQVDVSEWVSMMIAKGSFSQNIKMEAEVKIHEKGQGIGFLLSFPRTKKRRSYDEGYLLWFGSKSNPSLELYRSNALIAEVEDTFLENKWAKIVIEKVDDHLQVFINNKSVLSYTSHLPLPGSKIGLLIKDEDFSIRNFSIFGKSHKVKVSCLAVPNAFLARKEYETALEEYRKIGKSFPGRTEGREALFRAGLTILEKAKINNEPALFQKALEEFEKLYNTPGAPLEYLGKSMTYEALEDFEEEATCLEFALRKHKNHPLIGYIEDHVISRLLESALHDREAVYRLSLLSLLHLPKILENKDTKTLLLNLEEHWDKFSFLLYQKEDRNNFMALQLCFMLSREKILIEIIKNTDCKKTLENGLFSLLELGFIEKAKKLTPNNEILQIALLAHESLDKAIEKALNLDTRSFNLTYHLSQLLLDKNKPKVALKLLEKEKKHPLYLQALMFANEWEEVEKIFSKYSKEELLSEGTYLFSLYGCFLAFTRGEKEAISHFSQALELTYPSSWALLGQELTNRLSSKWEDQAFFYEKRHLYRQLALYSHCINNDKKMDEYLNKAHGKTRG